MKNVLKAVLQRYTKSANKIRKIDWSRDLNIVKNINWADQIEHLPRAESFIHCLKNEVFHYGFKITTVKIQPMEKH